MITITLTKAEEQALLHIIERVQSAQEWDGVRLSNRAALGMMRILQKLELAKLTGEQG